MNTNINDKYMSNSSYNSTNNGNLNNLGLITHQPINSNINSRVKYQSWSGTQKQVSQLIQMKRVEQKLPSIRSYIPSVNSQISSQSDQLLEQSIQNPIKNHNKQLYELNLKIFSIQNQKNQLLLQIQKIKNKYQQCYFELREHKQKHQKEKVKFENQRIRFQYTNNQNTMQIQQLKEHLQSFLNQNRKTPNFNSKDFGQVDLINMMTIKDQTIRQLKQKISLIQKNVKVDRTSVQTFKEGLRDTTSFGQIQENLRKTEKSLAEITQQKQNALKQIDNIKSQLKITIIQLQKSKRQNQSIKKQLFSTKQYTSQLKRQNESLKKQLVQTKQYSNQLKKQKNKLQIDVENRQIKIKTLLTKLNQHEYTQKSKQKDISRQTTKLQELVLSKDKEIKHINQVLLSKQDKILKIMKQNKLFQKQFKNQISNKITQIQRLRLQLLQINSQRKQQLKLNIQRKYQLRLLQQRKSELKLSQQRNYDIKTKQQSSQIIKNLQTTIQSLKTQLKNQQQKHNHSQFQLSKLSILINQLKQQIKRKNEKIFQIQSDSQNVYNQLQTLQKSWNKEKNLNQILSGRVQKIQESRVKLVAQKKELKQEAQKIMKRQKNQIQNLRSFISTLQNHTKLQNSTKIDKPHYQQQHYTNIQRQNQILKAQIYKLTNQLNIGKSYKQQKQNTKKWQKQVQNKKKRQQKDRSSLDSDSQQNNPLQAAIQMLNLQKQKMSQQISYLINLNHQQQQQIHQITNKLQNIIISNQQIRKAHFTYIKQHQQNQQSQSSKILQNQFILQIQQMNQHIQQKQQEINKILQKNKQMEIQLGFIKRQDNQQINHLRLQFDIINDQKKQLYHQIQSLTNTIIQLQKQKANHRTHIAQQIRQQIDHKIAFIVDQIETLRQSKKKIKQQKQHIIKSLQNQIQTRQQLYMTQRTNLIQSINNLKQQLKQLKQKLRKANKLIGEQKNQKIQISHRNNLIQEQYFLIKQKFTKMEEQIIQLQQKKHYLNQCFKNMEIKNNGVIDQMTRHIQQLLIQNQQLKQTAYQHNLQDKHKNHFQQDKNSMRNYELYDRTAKSQYKLTKNNPQHIQFYRI